MAKLFPGPWGSEGSWAGLPHTHTPYPPNACPISLPRTAGNTVVTTQQPAFSSTPRSIPLRSPRPLLFPFSHRGEGCLGGILPLRPLCAALDTDLTGTQDWPAGGLSGLLSLRKQPPGNVRPLLGPASWGCCSKHHPRSSRGPSTCSCTPISSSCGPPPAVVLPLLKCQSAALLTPD